MTFLLNESNKMSETNLFNESEETKQKLLGAILQNISPQYLEDIIKTEGPESLSSLIAGYSSLTVPNTAHHVILGHRLEGFVRKINEISEIALYPIEKVSSISTSIEISEEKRNYKECKALLNMLECNTIHQPQILAFCKEHDLFDGFKLGYILIKEIFKDIKDINIEYSEDPEIENYEKICFNVFLSNNNINAILDQEVSYNKELEKHIGKEKSEFFILTCTING